MEGPEASIGFVGRVVRDDDVPPVHAVRAPVDDDVAWYGRIVRRPRDKQMGPAPAIDARDDLIGERGRRSHHDEQSASHLAPASVSPRCAS